jgi:hypothetical protein
MLEMTKRHKRNSTGGAGAISLEQIRELALALPKAEEGTSYGTPAFRVGGKLFLRLHEDGESLVVKIDAEERAMRTRAEPETYFITEHYRNYPWMLVRLATVSIDDLRDLVEDAWRRSAPGRLAKAHDGGQVDGGRLDRQPVKPRRPR